MVAQSLKYKRRILVVDDEEECRTFLCDCLGQWQYEVIQATSGREALDELPRWPVDIVLLDMTMPQMDGAETLREIKRRYPDMTVFMMSALMTPRLKQHVLQWGARGCLEKPIEQAALSLALLSSPSPSGWADS
jgi:CheY-like chemotaxis protein